MRRRKNRDYKNFDIINFILLTVVIIEVVFLFFIFVKKRPAQIIVKEKPKIVYKGKIAIVLDDWGYSTKNFKYLNEIEYPLTLAILPDLAHSREAATEAKRNNKEIILHLPLEPHKREEYLGLELNTITTNMSKAKIKKILSDSINSVPYLKGISNHMGSKATENKEVMRTIFGELKKQNLYYLDSIVTDKSVCKKEAREIGLRFFERNVFLDNELEYEYIRKQLRQLVTMAQKKGRAIGIGHDRAVTLEVLRDEMPKIEDEGYLFVLVSELTK